MSCILPKVDAFTPGGVSSSRIPGDLIHIQSSTAPSTGGAIFSTEVSRESGMDDGIERCSVFDYPR
jgi:hypothetical protein